MGYTGEKVRIHSSGMGVPAPQGSIAVLLGRAYCSTGDGEDLLGNRRERPVGMRALDGRSVGGKHFEDC